MLDYKRLFVTPSAAFLGFLVFLQLLLLFLLLPASFAETRVCSEGCDFSGIQAAINNASPEDTIVVESGLYREPLIIGKRANLHGLHTGEGKPTLVPDSGRIILAAQGAILRGFEIGWPAGTDGSGFGSDNCTLEVVLPAGIYLNDFAGKKSVCPEDAASWNSSDGINYQYSGRVLRSRLGNYWADYNGSDENGDGIGDQPKVLNEKNIDYYPLMLPVDSYRIPDEKETKLELIRARVNEPFTISLPANPTTGYQWKADYDYVLLKEESAQFERASTGTANVGAGGTSVFVFTPLMPGKTTIYFVYKRSWENIVADTRSFHVEITA
ncbi:MAG: protease inhibitor I42 family protein [Methanothrix sp.]|nr:protease inhibitor I42 family protein [Methanothrix sp.]